jgi:hypothetical protein
MMYAHDVLCDTELCQRWPGATAGTAGHTGQAQPEAPPPRILPGAMLPAVCAPKLQAQLET